MFKDKLIHVSHFQYYPWWSLLTSPSIFPTHQNLTCSKTSPGFYMSAVQVFWKYRGRRRHCSLQAISPFSTVFSIHLKSFLLVELNLKLSSATSFSLEESKIGCLGKGWLQWLVGLLTHYQTVPHFDAVKIYSCGKHCEKRRNCL